MLISLNQNVWSVKNLPPYICACVSMAFPLGGTYHPQRLMSLNTAQSELIKPTAETGGEEGVCVGGCLSVGGNDL